MGVSLETVLVWAEKFAAVVSIAAPCLRQIVSILDTSKAEVVLIDSDER